MDDKKFSKDSRQIKLDPDSPNYRVCPACKKPHMVYNKGRDYCSNKCYQDFYNATHRVVKKQQTHLMQQEYNKDATKELLEANKKILDSLMLKPEGNHYQIQELQKFGFNFCAYSYRFPFNSHLNIQCVEYGEYQTFLIKPDVILIHKKTI